MEKEIFAELGETAHLVDFSTNYKIKDFDCGRQDYNFFIKKFAEKLHDECTSRTQLLIHNTTADVIGYISLCTGSIKLTDSEKEEHEINAPFESIPTLKIGMLAVDKNYLGKGYGSLLIYLTRGIAEELLESGIACKFIDVDADIDQEQSNLGFYKKNGFIRNERLNKSQNSDTISMRLEFLNYDNDEEDAGEMKGF